ncbi:helix-turn-helix domain-containing protein [Candidatus Venteria ishoeyi]|uniref:HTH cro/C1-type domain-containing protein n=1 Tax=Candidatus Venteria ishoeyi TaxID=1899563 RepID=A0A1H6FET0_9GAMM|nr:helix-turn-helix domain-containing protein [Candidatus Venteria ishoeyi]SEH07921.1 Uncharacterised protein [Candidatus Venteria ishoeyi]
MYHYKDCGLPNIYLKNGYIIEVHGEYGKLVSIEQLENLHDTIGLHIVKNSTKLMSGIEFRFLRIELDLSQVALGKLIGVSDQTIANYEKESPQEMADKFLRVIYMEKVCGNLDVIKILEHLNELDRMVGLDKDVALEEINDNWKIAA